MWAAKFAAISRTDFFSRAAPGVIPKIKREFAITRRRSNEIFGEIHETCCFSITLKARKHYEGQKNSEIQPNLTGKKICKKTYTLVFFSSIEKIRNKNSFGKFFEKWKMGRIFPEN